MTVVTEISAGGVVYRSAPDGIQVCLILDAYGYWTFPKGKIEPGETPQEAALREIAEEVGLRDLRLIDHVSDAAYRYRAGPDLVKKTVHWYLMEAPHDCEPQPRLDESIHDAGWFDPAQALKMIGYRTIRSVLRRALGMLRQGSPES